MSGPVRTTPSNSRARQNPVAKIRRPPNAWILFRKHTYELNKTEYQKKPQGECSKIISKMWKEASEAVRLKYEHLAEVAKEEHMKLYPGYRYQPQSREVTKMLRQEEKLQRQASGSGTRANPLPPVSTHPMIAPSVATQLPPPSTFFQGNHYPSITPPTSNEPSPTPAINVQVPQRVSSAASYATEHSSESFDSNLWNIDPAQQLLTPVSANTPLPASLTWPTIPSAEQSLSPTINSQDIQGTDMVHFELPENSVEFDINSMFSDIQALDPLGVFAFNYQLDNAPATDNVLASVGEMPSFDAYSYPYDEGIPTLDSYLLESLGPIAPHVDNTAQYEQYFNVDADFLASANTSSGSGSMIAPQVAPDSAEAVQASFSSSGSVRYVPPSGAAFSRYRRVAASWIPPVANDAPIDNESPRMFGVPAS